MAEREFNITVKGRDHASKQIAGINRRLHGLGRTATRIGGVLVAALGVRSLGRSINAARESIDSLGKTADKLGTSTQSLQAFQQAGEIAGVGNEALSKSFVRMERAISEASVGLSTPKRALEQIGTSVDDLMAMSPDEQFKTIADGINGLGNQSDKARIAADLFGRSGADLLNMFALGRDGIDAYEQEIQALGIALSRDQVASVEKANDSMNRMGKLFTGIRNKITVALAPAFQWFAKVVITAFTFIETVITQWSAAWEVTTSIVALALVGLGEDIKHLFTVKIPAYLNWLRENWKNIFTDMWNHIKTTYSNMFKNIKNFFTAVVSWLKGDGFDFEWTGLTEGFESSLGKLPKIAERQLTGLELELATKAAGAADTFHEEFNKSLDARLGVLNAAGGKDTPAGSPAGSATGQDAATGTGAAVAKSLSALQSRFLTGQGQGNRKLAMATRQARDITEQLKVSKESERHLADTTTLLERIAGGLGANRELIDI